MNAQRRKAISRIQALMSQFETLRDEIRDAIDEVKQEEQEYFDNMPESLQGGDKGQMAEAAISALEDAYSDIDNIDVEGISANLDTAAE